MRLTFVILLSFFLFSWVSWESNFGIEEAESVDPFLGVFPELSPNFGDWTLEDAFPNLTFTDPIAMHEIPAGYLIAGKHGMIWKVDAETSNEKKVALDIRNLVMTGEDAGLINFTLHPEFNEPTSENQGYIYLMYSYSPLVAHGNDPRMNRLSRFTYDANSESINPASELILIQDYDPQGYHMGGAMFFDEEGYFYFTVGDGGSGSFWDASQQIDKYLWGGMFRIDVDKDPSRSHPIQKQPQEWPGKLPELPETFTKDYFIPNDNPWQGTDVLEEFFALGLRSPHSAHLDKATGDIWVGDVGEATREEISIITKGGNAQWPYKEGSVSGLRSKPASIIGNEIAPKFDYARGDGMSVIGGFVYRGEKWLSQLEGFYIFGDHKTGNIWSLDPNTEEVKLMAVMSPEGPGNKSGISAFASNAEGDVFVLNLFDTNQDGGKIYKLKFEQGPAPQIPNLLSETGAFLDLQNLTPAPGLIPYKPISPLWSDGATKKRWMALPNDGIHDTPAEQITFSKTAPWQFPSGTVFIKHFELPIDENDPSQLRRLETRFFIVDLEGNAYGLTYKWNDQGTDAELLPGGLQEAYEVKEADGMIVQQTWDYPNRLQCNSCHNANAGFVLGVKSQQLNHEIVYENGSQSNQLATLNHLNAFLGEDVLSNIEEITSAVSLDDPDASLEEKVMSYLDANCSHCHQPNGVEGAFDARLSTPLSAKNIINQFGISHTSQIGERIVTPLHPEHSLIWQRDISIDDNKMPPLAKNVVDEKYIEILTEWINRFDESSLGDCNVTYLSNFEYLSNAENGKGPIEYDLSNGEADAGDGEPMVMNGIRYHHGIGVFGESELTYDLNGNFELFTATIGIQDGTCDEVKLRFEVFLDGELVYQSNVMELNYPSEKVGVDVSGGNKLTLKVSSQGTDACDMANWGEAKLHSCIHSLSVEPVAAFAFGADDYTTTMASDDDREFIKIIQNGENFMYDPSIGYGYVDTTGIDETPNNRDIAEEELFDQFIGAKEGEIVFRVDVPNGRYKLMMIGGDPFSPKVHNIKVRTRQGYHYDLISDLRINQNRYFKIGIADLEAPNESTLQIKNYGYSPTILVENGYIEIVQGDLLYAGGDLNILEIWPFEPFLDTPQFEVATKGIQANYGPNPFEEQFEIYVFPPEESVQRVSLAIYDMSGRLLFRDESFPMAKSKSIYTSSWSRGVYVISLRAGDYSSSFQVVKQ